MWAALKSTSADYLITALSEEINDHLYIIEISIIIEYK